MTVTRLSSENALKHSLHIGSVTSCPVSVNSTSVISPGIELQIEQSTEYPC